MHFILVFVMILGSLRPILVIAIKFHMTYTQKDAQLLFVAAYKVKFDVEAPGEAEIFVESELISKLVYYASKMDTLSEECTDMLTSVHTLGDRDAHVVSSQYPDKALELYGLGIEFDGAEYTVSYCQVEDDGMKVCSDCNTSYIIEPYIVDGFQLNPNPKVVAGIIKGIKRCKGECPCHNPYKGTPDAICPCKGYREENHCCCTLYVPVDGE